MSEYLAHQYIKEGTIDALKNHINEHPNYINSKDDVSILIYIYIVTT